jgi:hypothetical protein
MSNETDEMIQIEKWKLDKIEDAMRININAHSMKNKECCAHRQMIKAHAWVAQALEVAASTTSVSNPHCKSDDFVWWADGRTD